MVGITGFYTYYASKQADAATKAVVVAQDQVRLARDVARTAYGGARLRVYAVGVYTIDSENRIAVNIMVQNDGEKLPAENMEVAANIGLTEPSQRTNIADFKEGFKKPNDLTALPPYDKTNQTLRTFQPAINCQFAPSEYSRFRDKQAVIYIGGIFQHTEYDLPIQEWFCVEVPASDAFSPKEVGGAIPVFPRPKELS